MANYINNADFLIAIKEYKAALAADPNVRVPEYIGKCLYDIATKFSMKPNFYGYSFRDEMVSDGIENCLMYINNFDPEKSSNPFSYFTQIVYYAFLRRIMKEKKQSYIKHKLIQEMPTEAFELQDHDDSDLASSYAAFVQVNNSFDGASFERAMERKKVKRKTTKTPLEELFEEEPNDPSPEV